MKNTSQASFLPVVHELARTYQAFEQFASQHIRQLGLTPPQFDVVATLGHSKGMNCKELSDRTLITKGTLTGVIDRLEDKGLVTRTMQPNDRRSVFVSLTQHGERLFDQAFPPISTICRSPSSASANMICPASARNWAACAKASAWRWKSKKKSPPRPSMR